MNNIDFYQFLNHENVRVNSITPTQKKFIKENIDCTNLDIVDIDFMDSEQAKEEIEEIIRIKNEEHNDMLLCDVGAVFRDIDLPLIKLGD